MTLKMTNRELIEKLNKDKVLQKRQWAQLISTYTEQDALFAKKLARKIADEIFGNKVYIRGIVEFSNYCKNDCFYCGIRRSNKNCERYRLTKEEILECCDEGRELGFMTFVLQSGEDKTYSTESLCQIVQEIKKNHPDCAVTLSLGEMEYADYKALFDAGADRYLLRHETASKSHYEKLHPENMSFQRRMKCLENLKQIGFQTGCGMMIGSPFQTAEDLAEDMLFISRFKPEMVGMGPFIAHKDTPFANEKAGSVELTLFLISLLRIMLPEANIPATTALGTLGAQGRELGILAGANVVMPNLSPTAVRKKYALYDNKICTGDESAQCVICLKNRLKNIGYEIVVSRGDYIGKQPNERK